MMLGAKLSDEMQGKLWAEAIYTAMRLSNLVPSGTNDRSPDEQWYGRNPGIEENLVHWGTIGFVTVWKKQPKLSPKSVKCVFVGYTPDHFSDTYRFYNLETKKVITSCDVRWAELHGSQDIPASLRMCARDKAVDVTDDQIGEDNEEEEIVVPTEDSPNIVLDDEDDFEGVLSVAAERKTGVPLTLPDPMPTPIEDDTSAATSCPKLSREVKNLQTFYNPTPTVIEPDEENDGIEEQKDDVVEAHYVYNAELASDPNEPRSYIEVKEGTDKEHWVLAIKNEIENFLCRKVWKVVLLGMLKKGQRPVKVKWIFKKKYEQDLSMRYKGRIVVRGFVQIPGIDYTHTHSPVANETLVRVLFCIILWKSKDGWIEEMVDIEATFLEADLNEDVFIEFTEGLTDFGYMTPEEQKGKCIKLEKTMYRCVQSPRAFFKELSIHLKKIGLKQCIADPCLWYWKDKDNDLTLLIATYMDNIVVAGKPDEIQKFKDKLCQRFKISELGRLKKHLGIFYERNKDELGEYFLLEMEKYQDNIVRDYAGITGRDPRPAKTPGYPGESLVCSQEEEGLNTNAFCKLLGKLIWFTKKILPETSNAICEIAMMMDKPNKEHWKALERLVGYILNANCRIKLRKPEDLKINGFVDSKDNGKSVTVYIIVVGGFLIACISKTQNSMTLSSYEAEYTAALMAATEVKFIQIIFEEVLPKEKTRPATLLVDNMAAIYLVNNQSVGARTKHIDIRLYHIREMKNEMQLLVKFIRSENNLADLETKNVTEKIHDTLSLKLKDGDIMCIIYTATREDVKKGDDLGPSADTSQDSAWNVVVAGRKTNNMIQA